MTAFTLPDAGELVRSADCVQTQGWAANFAGNPGWQDCLLLLGGGKEHGNTTP